MPNEQNSLRIFITATDEPAVGNDFVRTLLEFKKEQVLGMGIVRGDSAIPSVAGGRTASAGAAAQLGPGGRYGRIAAATSRLLATALSRVLIFGPLEICRQSARRAAGRLRETLARLGWRSMSRSLEAVAEASGIPVWRTASLKDRVFLTALAALRPDVIIHQAHDVPGGDYLRIARVGVLSWHGALPPNPGRFSDFRVLLREEPVTVTVRCVGESLAVGSVLVRKRVAIAPGETVAGLARKCHAIAPYAMAEAIELLERGAVTPLADDNTPVTRDFSPTLADALQFRLQRICRGLVKLIPA